MIAPVAVGFDGSDHSKKAVEYAAAEADLRGRPLLILHVTVLPVVTAPRGRAQPWPGYDKLRESIEEMVAETADAIRGRYPKLDVQTDIIDSLTVGYALIERSAEFEILVMGSRGRGGFAGLLLGSTSSQVAGYADCPVIVTREPADSGPHDGAVVVCVDDTELSQDVLQFAFETASLRRTRLVAVHAWQYPMYVASSVIPVVPDRQAQAEESASMLAEALAGWSEKYPDVTVTRQLIEGPARRVLLDEAKGADLLVIGSRGRGGFARLVLGSTSHAMLHHAKTNVAIVHVGDVDRD